MRHCAAAADVVFLPLVRQLRAERVARPVKRRDPPVLDVDGVDILHLVVDGRRRRATSPLTIGSPLAVELVDVRIVDDAVVLDLADVEAHREGVAERDVEHQVRVEVVAARPVGLPEVHLRLAAERLRVRLVHDVADVAGERTRAIQRALRAAQHFDVVDVLQDEVAEQRRVVDVRRHGGRRRERHVAVGAAVDVDAADDDAAAPCRRCGSRGRTSTRRQRCAAPRHCR